MAAILAGGQGRRMGGASKPLLSIGQARIIDRQLAVLDSVVDDIVIVANEPGLYETFGVRVWSDLVPDAGPLGGIYTALVTGLAPTTIVVGGDMPFLTAAFLEHVQDAGQHADVAIPRTAAGHQPLCATYSDRCTEPIRRQLHTGRRRVIDLLPHVRVREIGPDELAPFDPDGRLFFNINTPSEYTLARTLHDSATP